MAFRPFQSLREYGHKFGTICPAWDEGWGLSYTPCLLMKPALCFRLPSPKQNSVFLLLQMCLPFPWQPHFRSNADRAYNTLHFASKVVCQMGALPPLGTPARKGDMPPLHGAHIVFSCYPTLRPYLSSKSKRGCGVVSLTLGNSGFPIRNTLSGYIYLFSQCFLREIHCLAILFDLYADFHPITSFVYHVDCL